MFTNRLWYILLALVILSFLILSVARGEEVDMSIIAQIESGGNPYAYNPKSGAVGLYQITPICLEEYYLDGLTMADMYNPQLSLKVANWYMNRRIPKMLKYYNIPDTIENRLFAYNAGIGKVIKGIKPKETINYIKKYKRLARKK